MNRRDQWIQFYTSALAGHCVDLNPESADHFAAQSADAAMARLDARDFPEPKVQVLIKAAREVALFAGLGEGPIPPVATDALGKALASFGEES